MGNSISGVVKKSKVDVTEIHRSYIISELSKAVSEKERRTSFVNKLAGFINVLDKSEVVDFIRLLSNDYRKNGVHSYTTKNNFEWYMVEAPVDKVYLTPTNEKETAILANLPNPWNLKSLIERIQKGETEGLEDFLKKGVEIIEFPIAVYERLNEKEEPKIQLIDGMHRTPALLTKNKSETLSFYLGVKL